MGTTRDYTILMTARADLQDALGKIKRVDTSLHSLKSTALELTGALGIGFSVAGLVDFVKNTIEADQQVGNLAKTLGVSTEQLSALEQESKKAGVQVDALEASMVALTRSATGQNAQGAKALDVMGISAKDARGNLKPLPALLQEVSSKFAGYQEGTGKAALATALFGRAGAQLIPLLDQLGNEGLDNITQKAIAAGTAISQDAVKASNDFANALDDLKAKLQGAANEGLEQFTPQIDALAEKVDDPAFQKALLDTADGIVAITTAAANGIADLAKFISTMQDLAGFSLDGHVGGEVSNVFNSAELDAYTAEQQKRQNEGFVAGHLRREGAIGGALAKNNPYYFLSQLAIGKSGGDIATDQIDQTLAAHAATMSDADLKAQIDKLTAEKKAYDADTAAADANAKAKANAARSGAMDKAAGDIISGILDDGKQQAPVLPTAADQERAKAMAAALQKLQDQFSTLRIQGLDPTATAWAKYNKTVDDAVAEAAKAGNTAEAKAALTGIVEQAARLRDVDLKKIADDDRDAYKKLKQSLETPAEVKLEDAVQQILDLNGYLRRGVITAQEYEDALKRVGQQSVVAAPKYQGVDAVVGGAFGELNKNTAAMKALEDWHAQALAANQKFRQKDTANEVAYQARLANIEKQYAAEKQNIEQARQQLLLITTANLFGQLATLSSSHNKKVAAIGKAAAIAQAIINTYKNATIAYGDGLEAGGPYGVALGAVFAAVAVAAGLANVAAIRAQSVGGYAEGGYTGPGFKYQPAGIVHAGEVVFSQADVQRHGGVQAVESMRRGMRGYADGGMVAPFANAPTPAQLGFATPRTPRAEMGDGYARGAPQPISLKNILVLDKEVIPSAMSGADGSRVTMAHIKANIPTIRAWVNGKKN